MMVVRVSKVTRVLVTGPLAPFAEAYGAELRARGYTALSTVDKLRQVARLSGWLEERGLSAAQLSDERIGQFMVLQRARWRDRSRQSRRALTYLQDVLADVGVLVVEELAQPSSPADLVLASFKRYLLTERGMAAGSVSVYVRQARCFLDTLAPAVELLDLTPAMVSNAVLGVAKSGRSVSATQLFVSGLRSFLQFCFVEDLAGADLSQAALLVTGRRRSMLPKGISRGDATALLGSCDRRTAVGRRDYALILLMLRLGLRRGEVAAMTLDDINWTAGELAVRGKGGRLDRLPLPTDVGQAIAAYLRHGRPSCDRREVFLRARAPHAPIEPRSVGSAVQRACRRAQITEIGAHRLRHTLACQMVAADVPLRRIGQVLRHRSLQSTAIYARVDVDRLRRLARPWPDGGTGQ